MGADRRRFLGRKATSLSIPDSAVGGRAGRAGTASLVGVASERLSGIFLAQPERPPDGPRLAVKDLFDTAGLVTTYGSILFVDHVPERTAEAGRRLEGGGGGGAGREKTA